MLKKFILFNIYDDERPTAYRRNRIMVSHDKEHDLLEINTRGLSEVQTRLLKSLNSILRHMVETDEEPEFFSASAESLRICAGLIKLAGTHGASSPPQTRQALEYAIDALQEYMSASDILRYDN